MLAADFMIRQVSIHEDLDPELQGWKELSANFQNDAVHFAEPDWLRVYSRYFASQGGQLQVFLVQAKGQSVGVAPFVTFRRKWLPGSLPFVGAPLRQIRFIGGAPNLPPDDFAYDALFRETLPLARVYDMIWIDALRVDSFLWHYLQRSPLVRRGFSLYARAFPHPLIRLSGSYEQYLKRFSSKTRQNRLREIKRLRAVGELELIRVSRPEHINPFVEMAASISAKTYQTQRLGLGFHDTDFSRALLRLAADRGWLRSYVLICGGVPISFIRGYQRNGRYYYVDIGYDPQWARFSVGTVLFFLALEDLFRTETPELFDFGAGDGYKGILATGGYTEVSACLFPRRLYPMLTLAMYRSSDTACRTAVELKKCFMRVADKLKQRRPHDIPT